MKNRKTNKMNSRNVVMLAAGIMIFVSCNNNNKPKFTDTPTSGEISIAVDESYQPLFSAQLDTFMGLYTYARVHAKFLPETEVFKQLLTNDSIRVIVANRELRQDEMEVFKSRNLFPRTTKVAIDAVALVVNTQNKDTALSYEQLAAIMQGKLKSWSQLGKQSATDSITIVFDKNGSSNFRYLQEKFLEDKKTIPGNWFAVNSNAEVIEYISKNKGGIGVISVNWISDKDDPMANRFLEKVNVVQLSLPDTVSGEEADKSYCKPMQAYIALKQYPLIRDVYIISREGRNGLGTGFAAFVAGDQGQRIVRLMGLLPATMPVRLIQVN